ncbi:cellulose binding domain-containing protein [Micromonospora sp. WMMD1082]|uniref:cellulose binding domain-containing protein n=1 Tax=Micromonospora sp. WMMD1082 TaxID=3016104 RepID=UPI0024179B7D|nr:cellulose binding domain-containing protein [Micromonospora sp. WMMD1082]MDG4796751.1 cellulose binding domain-containing protein [Micromonospora sp. WMMD1082]
MRRAPRQIPPRGSAAVASSSPWILVSIGVGIMVVLIVVAVGAYRGPGPDFQPAPPEPPPVAAVPVPERASSAGREASAPPSPAVPGLSPRRTGPPSPTPTASPTPSPSAPPSPAASSPTASAPAPPAPLEVRYRVTNSFQGGFVAELRIRNTSRDELDWVARVDYPGGRVVAAWLVGVPQGTFSGVGGTLTYRSGRDLAGGASVRLRFHIESAPSRPASCRVSGRACDGL